MIIIAVIRLIMPICSSTLLMPLLVIRLLSPVMIKPIPLLISVVVVTVFAKFFIHTVFRYGIVSVSLGDVIVIIHVHNGIALCRTDNLRLRGDIVALAHKGLGAGNCHAVEHVAHALGGHAGEGAGDELHRVIEHPAGDGGVVHHQHVVADEAQPAVDLPAFMLFVQRAVRRDHALTAAAAYCQLHRHNGNAHDDEEQQIKDHKNAAAVGAAHVGEFPDVADADGAARAHQQKAEARLKALSFHRMFLLE